MYVLATRFTGTRVDAAVTSSRSETLATDSPLFDVPNLLLTPHVSGAFQGLWDLVVELFCENLSRYLANRPLLNLAHRERGY
jgi:phosphoglycerate dehydrogenase-like enzyme